MALNINTNIGALNAAAAASSVNKMQETAMERLSTGQRINTAADDAAGVAIASRLTSEIKGINQAIRNSMDGQAMIDTAEGAHIEISNILQRMRELAVQSANDTNGDADRANLQLEIDQLANEIDHIATSTTWAGISLLNGTASAGALATSSTDIKSFDFQIGARNSSADSLSVSIGAVTANALGVGGTAESPTVSSEVVSVTGEGTLNVSTDTISFGGKFNSGDTYAVTVNGTAMSITASYEDGYSDDAAGLAAQMADEIRTSIGDNSEVVNNGDGSLTIVSAPKITAVSTTDGGGAATGTFTYDKSTGTFSVGGTHENTDVYTLTVNGTATTVTTANTTNAEYPATKAGVVAELVDTINANTTYQGMGVSAYVDEADPTKFHVTQSTTLSAATYTPLASSTSPTMTGAEVSGASTLTFANTPAVGDKFSADINGVNVSIEIADGDGYDSTATGAAQQMVDAIQSKIDSGELIGVTVANAAGVVTITQSATTTDWQNLAVSDVGDDTDLSASYSAGVLTLSGATEGTAGAVDAGDTVSFSINGVDLSVTASELDGYADDTNGFAAQVAAAINDNAELKAMGITATNANAVSTSGSEADAKVTLAFKPQFENVSVTQAPDVSVTQGANGGDTTITVNKASFANGDVINTSINGQDISLTISSTDGVDDSKVGVAAQLASAIEAQGLTGVSVTDNGDGTLSIGSSASASVATAADARRTISTIDEAMSTINSQRANLGAVSNRLDSTVSNLTNISTNLEAGRSRIQDADFAAESTNLAKAQILQQASMAMLAQANASKQGVLSLLQG